MPPIQRARSLQSCQPDRESNLYISLLRISLDVTSGVNFT